MNNLIEPLSKSLNLAKQYPTSLLGGLRNRKLFNQVKTYCMFIGYRRSGKTLTASLLDAHPNIIIADELSALKYIHAGFTRRQIWHLLVKESRLFTSQGRTSKGHSHRIPTQWQGRFRKLLVIGDNKGEGATLRLRARPWLLARLYKTMGVRIRFFHVIRNPYDNISSISKRMNKTLAESIEWYFSLCQTVTDIKKQLNAEELFEFRHEAFIDNPKDMLSKICTFLDVDTSEDYLNDCASIVLKSPHQSRHQTTWDQPSIDLVKTKMADFPFLRGYSYEE